MTQAYIRAAINISPGGILMAKTPPKATGTSRIRFIMVDAEISDGGDLTQVTQAIQNALRPPAQASRLVAPTQPRPNGAQAGQLVVDRAEPAEQEEQEGDISELQEVVPSTAAAPKAPRKKVRTPDILELDLTTEPSFSQFAAEKNPSSHQMRFLTIAAWFKLHRALDAVTPSHIYTCYRHAKWTTDVDDFAQPLRLLKHRQLVNQRERGFYEINHLGLQEVENLRKA